MGSATLIMKATRRCNLRCAYCHDWRVGPGNTMRFDVLAATVASALSDPHHDQVTFIWHGGEATLLPISFYQKALYLQSQFRRPGQAIENVVQTNATLLNDQWVKFFRRYKFGVGVSVDGPSEIHDKVRTYRSGQASLPDALRGVRLLKEYGVNASALMVIDREALRAGPEKIYEFFVEQGIFNFSFLAATPTNMPKAPPGSQVRHYVSPQEICEFLSRLFDLRNARGDNHIVIRELDTLLDKITGNPTQSCKLAGQCFGSFYIVEPNGKIAHCDLFLGDQNYEFGNILQQDFVTFRRSPEMLTLRRQNVQRLAQLESCPEYSICNGWCPHEAYLSQRHNVAHSSKCCGLSSLINHIRTRLSSSKRTYSAV